MNIHATRFNTVMDSFLHLSTVVVRNPIGKGLLLGALVYGCSTVAVGAPADKHHVPAAERLAAIKHAQVWQRTDVGTMNMKTGPQGKGTYPPDTTVTCTYLKEPVGGRTPKFNCALADETKVRVRYGRDNNEIFAGVAATRLLWALGFGADVLYPVHVICHGCPKSLTSEPLPSGDSRFDFAAIERTMHGREMEAPSVGPGWAWPELDLVDERAGGAPLAQRDALKLLAVMLQHTDSKANQQKLLCLDNDAAKNNLGKCPETFMMIHDVGLTFGTATLMNGQDRSSVNLHEWARTPIWKDARRCVGNL